MASLKTVTVGQIGALTEAAPTTDTASAGLNGRLQRIAQRLTSLIALLPTALGANGGLKVEGVASGTVVPVVDKPATSGGTLGYHLVALDGTNANSVKGSGGQVYGIDAFNDTDYPVFIKFYDKATAPTVGTDTPVKTFGIQSGVRGNCPIPKGMAFTLGIAIAITKLIDDSDTTSVVAGDCVVDVDYK